MYLRIVPAPVGSLPEMSVLVISVVCFSASCGVCCELSCLVYWLLLPFGLMFYQSVSDGCKSVAQQICILMAEGLCLCYCLINVIRLLAYCCVHGFCNE